MIEGYMTNYPYEVVYTILIQAITMVTYYFPESIVAKISLF